MNTRGLLLLLLLALVPAGSTMAGVPAPFQEEGLLTVRSPGRPAISASRAAEMAKRAVGGGRVLSAEAQEQGGRTVYRVKVLTREGEVRYVYVDAESGQVHD